jgi:hypothetical protein
MNARLTARPRRADYARRKALVWLPIGHTAMAVGFALRIYGHFDPFSIPVYSVSQVRLPQLAAMRPGVDGRADLTASTTPDLHPPVTLRLPCRLVCLPPLAQSNRSSDRFLTLLIRLAATSFWARWPSHSGLKSRTTVCFFASRGSPRSLSRATSSPSSSRPRARACRQLRATLNSVTVSRWSVQLPPFDSWRIWLTTAQRHSLPGWSYYPDRLLWHLLSPARPDVRHPHVRPSWSGHTNACAHVLTASVSPFPAARCTPRPGTGLTAPSRARPALSSATSSPGRTLMLGRWSFGQTALHAAAL